MKSPVVRRYQFWPSKQRNPSLAVPPAPPLRLVRSTVENVSATGIALTWNGTKVRHVPDTLSFVSIKKPVLRIGR